MSKTMALQQTPESWKTFGIFYGHEVEVLKEDNGLFLIAPVDRDMFTQFRGIVVNPEWVLPSSLISLDDIK